MLKSKNVKGEAVAITAFNVYLEYVVRFEINRILQSGTIPTSEEIAEEVGKHLVDDYKKFGPGVVRELGKAIKERIGE